MYVTVFLLALALLIQSPNEGLWQSLQTGSGVLASNILAINKHSQGTARWSSGPSTTAVLEHRLQRTLQKVLE